MNTTIKDWLACSHLQPWGGGLAGDYQNCDDCGLSWRGRAHEEMGRRIARACHASGAPVVVAYGVEVVAPMPVVLRCFRRECQPAPQGIAPDQIVPLTQDDLDQTGCD